MARLSAALAAAALACVRGPPLCSSRLRVGALAIEQRVTSCAPILTVPAAVGRKPMIASINSDLAVARDARDADHLSAADVERYIGHRPVTVSVNAEAID